MPLVILAIGILVLFFLIVKVKLNSFLALLLVAGAVGLAEGMPIDKLIPTIEKGLGGTLGGLAIVVSFGAMLGKLMAESGGAQRIATTLINVFGRENVKWAVCLTGFIVGIALFYEIGFVLLIPLVFTIAAEAKIPLLEVGIPMAAALSVTHGFLPPHPGPTAISIIYNADIGTTLVYGAIIAIPTAIVAGPLYCTLTRDINPEIPKGMYNPKIFKDDEMPGFGISVFTALVPVILMAASAIAKLTMGADVPARHVLTFFGQPDIALTISVAIAIYTFGLGRGKSMEEVMKTVQDAVLTIAMILLIVGGGGALTGPHRQRRRHVHRQPRRRFGFIAAAPGLAGRCCHPYGLRFGYGCSPDSRRYRRAYLRRYRCQSGTDGLGHRCWLAHLQPAERPRFLAVQRILRPDSQTDSPHVVRPGNDHRCHGPGRCTCIEPLCRLK